MIERILPAAVAVEEAAGPLPGAALFPEEEAVVARAVEKRREEFTTGRELARRALSRLGVAPRAIGTGERREPQWPEGIVGSITHCTGYRGAAVAREADVVAVGIDAEPNEPLPDGILRSIGHGGEPARVARLAVARPDVCWDRLLFSAKESVYKAWFPLTQRWLGFKDATLTIDPDSGTFTARLLVPGPVVGGGELRDLEGRWSVQGEHVLTAVTVLPAAS